MGAETAIRLRVPVLLLGRANIANQFPFKENFVNALGYSGEAHVHFGDFWSLQNGDPVTDHPQFLYAATFVRAITFLDGFFDPVTNSTEDWSLWDNEAPQQATSVDDAIVSSPAPNAPMAPGSPGWSMIASRP